MSAQWVGGGYLVTPAGKSLVVERWQQLGMWHPVTGTGWTRAGAHGYRTRCLAVSRS